MSRHGSKTCSVRNLAMSELRSNRVDSETASFSLELGRLAMQLCWSRDVLVLLFFKQSTDELKAEPPGFSWLAFLLETLSSTTGKANLGLLDTLLSWLLAFLLRQSIDKSAEPLGTVFS